MTYVGLVIIEGVKDMAEGVGYLWGAKPLLGIKQENGHVADCSGAVQDWAFRAGLRNLHREGRGTLRIEDWAGSWTQRQWCNPVDLSYAMGPQGIGCLLFMQQTDTRPGHVGLSLGSGWTLECRSRHGVWVVDPTKNRTRPWTLAGKLPEMFEETTCGG